jgi:hypothetical protein
VTVIEQETGPMTESSATPSAPADPIVRPAPHRWIWYAFGGGLPERHRGWVLHDTTARTWWLRHVARMLVQLAIPIALLMALLPASWELRAACAGGGLALAVFYSIAYMPEAVEHRVMKAGYPVGTATAHREAAGLVRQRRESDRKRAAAAKRAARYRDRLGR